MSQHLFDKTEITEELQTVRINYFKKLEEISELKQNLLNQKKKSENFAQIGRIMAAQYLKLKVWLYNLLIKFLKKEKNISSENQSKFNYNPYHIQIPALTPLKRKKIIHAIPSMSTGGSQQLVVDIVENLSMEYEHLIITAGQPAPSGYFGISISSFNIFEKDYEHQLVQFINETKPTLIHVHFWARLENKYDWQWYHSVFEAAFKLNIKVIQNCNNPTFPYFHDKIVSNIYVSKYAEETFGLNISTNTVIYPGSNFKKFTRTNEYIAGNTIGMVYRLEKDKLDMHSIEPFINAVKKRPQTKALIVGGGSWFELYKNRVEEEGLADNFEFPGYVSYDDLPKYYERLSIFVAPVHKESFGQVTPFAMNMCIPVVGYNVGALQEIIADQKLLAKAGDFEELGNIIVDLLDNKESMYEIGKKNHSRAQELFSVNIMIEGYKELYNSLAQ